MSTNIFPLVTNVLSLELVNTEVVSYGVRRELLNNNEEIKNWIENMHEKGLLKGFEIGNEKFSSNEIQKIKEFRSQLRNVFEKYIEYNELCDEWHSYFEDKISIAPLYYQMIDGELLARANGDRLEAFQSLIAFDVLNFIAKGDIKYIRRCTNPECILLFLDKTGRKKWCSMKICGNRNKVKKYNERVNDNS